MRFANLQVADVRTELARPHIRIRNGAVERRAAADRSALVGRGNAGRPSGVESPRASTHWCRTMTSRSASLIPGRVVKTFSRHTLRKLPNGLQGSWRRPPRDADHSSRSPHVYQPCFGRRKIAGRSSGMLLGTPTPASQSAILHVAVDDEAAVGNLFRVAEWIVNFDRGSD